MSDTARAAAHVSPKVSAEEMEATRVARFRDLKKFNVAFVDSLLPEHRKKNLKVIGRGVVEDPRMSPPIAEDHGFTVAFITCEPGQGAGLHSHETAEVFMPLNGNLVVYWGDDGEEELELEPWDTISVPQGVMRGFRNATDKELVILAMVGQQDGGGPVTWHPDILARAKDTGLAVQDGKLVRLDNFALPEGMEEIETG
ncbi:MAG: cupin domain-containing protein [Alphaproteobacteria bacterium]|nr:cupin domain-containing protein [Alphaproteobacteria bacterium]